MFDLTPMQDATEICHYPDLGGEPQAGVKLFFRQEHITEIFVLGN